MTHPATEPAPTPSSVKPAAARLPRAGQRVDVLLIGCTVAFAFLAASFAAANSDLWLHLAAGRLIATGGYAFGVDPFAYTTDGIYWANHAWLFDLLLYQAFKLFGGAGLVVLKAAGVAVLGGLMLRLAIRPGGSVWLGAGCVLLALLAMSPRLLLQPQCASLVLLAACVYLLSAPLRGLRVAANLRAHYAVPVLIALWVNIDGWFVLGPILVALFAIAERIGGESDAPKQPKWLLPVCLAACLLSPHHIRAFALPPELAPAVWSSEFRDDPRFAGFFAHPWKLGPLGRSGGYNLAAWAFFALVAAGIASFLVNRRAAFGWRGLVWLSFAILAAWQARLVPFFAVVAGPIAALNFESAFASRNHERIGRTAVGFAALVLLILAWPGWLQGFRARDRAIAWNVAPNPSLVRAAETLADWRERGLLPAGSHVFTTHPDVAHYLAWHAPNERGFLDSRLQLFTGVAGENLQVARSLGFVPSNDFVDRGERVVEERAIVGAVLYDADRQTLSAGLRKTQASDRWDLLRIDGQAVIVAYRGTSFAKAVAKFDPERAAFGPPREGELPPVSAAELEALPEPAVWWNLAANRAKYRSWAADAAPVYLRLFEQDAGGAGERSPALPLLAVRAARGGLALQPDSDEAWLHLAGAYYVLGRGTWEGTAGADLTLLRFLRLTQVTAALYQSVVVYPDSATARGALADSYLDREFFDLALQQRRAQYRLVQRAGPSPGESSAAFAERMKPLAEAVERIEYAVLDAENRFLVRTDALAGNPLARARVAQDLGLAGKALDTLLKSHPDLYGLDGIRLLLELLLQTGQIAEARVLLDREEIRRNPDALKFYELPGRAKAGSPPWGYNFPAYDWFDFCQSAAAGRYERAEAVLDRLRDKLERAESVGGPRMRFIFAAHLAFETGLGVPPGSVLGRILVARDRESWGESAMRMRFLTAERADLHALGGILRLERGDIAGAAFDFDRALALYESAKEGSPALPGQLLARRYREAIRTIAN